MEKVVLTLRFLLANGGEGKVTIRDVKNSASPADIKALVDGILEMDTIVNNDKPVELIECIKSVTTDEVLQL